MIITKKFFYGINEGDILLVPDAQAGQVEVLCYKGSCSVESGFRIMLLDDAPFTFEGDDFDSTILAQDGNRVMYTNLPRDAIKVTNPSNDCELCIRCYR